MLMNPTTSGRATARVAGRTISRSDDLVAMSMTFS